MFPSKRYFNNIYRQNISDDQVSIEISAISRAFTNFTSLEEFLCQGDDHAILWKKHGATMFINKPGLGYILKKWQFYWIVTNDLKYSYKNTISEWESFIYHVGWATLLKTKILAARTTGGVIVREGGLIVQDPSKVGPILCMKEIDGVYHSYDVDQALREVLEQGLRDGILLLAGAGAGVDFGQVFTSFN